MVEDGEWSGRIRTGKVTSTEQTTTATCCITENTITKLTWFLIKSALSSVVATESWFQPWLKGGAREREKSLANSANFSLGSCTLVARAPRQFHLTIRLLPSASTELSCGRAGPAGWGCISARWLQRYLPRDLGLLESFTQVLNLRYVGHFAKADDTTFHALDYARA